MNININIGDIVTNEQGWQGEVISRSPKFGGQYLVQYASRREWEGRLALCVVVRATALAEFAEFVRGAEFAQFVRGAEFAEFVESEVEK